MSRKRCKRKVYASGFQSLVKQKVVMYKYDHSDMSEEEQTDLLLPAYLALDELRVGNLDEDMFITLNEYNCATWLMAALIDKSKTSDETGDVAIIAKDCTEKAAEMLAELAERWKARGSFVAKSSELDAIRASFDLCSQLIALLPSGMVLQALLDAEKMVREVIDQHDMGVVA